MRGVSELYGRHPESDIYVVGTGTSLRVFPTAFFEGKITIGLNSAWRHLPVTYGLTIHPDHHIPECLEGESPRPEITWITKERKARRLLGEEAFRYADQHFYTFENEGKPNTMPAGDISDSGRVTDWLLRPTGDCLYIWTTISQAGMNLAANLGARNVILVGCDNCSLLENHHAHQQHTRWLSAAPDHRYHQYYEGLAEAREYLRRRGVNVFSISPFLGLKQVEHDFVRLCGELGKQELIPPAPDISPKAVSPPAAPAGLQQIVGRVKRKVERLLPDR